MDNRTTVINWVTELVKSLVVDPDSLTFKAVTDEKGLLITAYAPKKEIGRLIGRKGKTAEGLRAIVATFGMMYDTRASIKIENSEL